MLNLEIIEIEEHVRGVNLRLCSECAEVDVTFWLDPWKFKEFREKVLKIQEFYDTKDENNNG